MAGIDVDVDSVRDFRNDLLNLTEDLLEQLKRTDAAIEDAASEWNDPQFKKFYDSFQQDMETIAPLCERINEFESVVLGQYEEKVRIYLGM